MLDAPHSFTLPELPTVLFFPDTRLAQGFYAIPRPRVALDDQGSPQLNLMIYGHKDQKGAELHVRGGVLTLTTALALDPDEEPAAQAALARRLRERAGTGTDELPPAPVLLAVDWLGGEVEIIWTAELKLTGKVAGVGGVRCSLQQKLDAEVAQALRRAWEDGLPNSRIVYRMQARTATGPLPLTLEGPLARPGDSLRRSLSVLEM